MFIVIPSYCMVTEADMKQVIERWKRGIRPLKIHEQKYGEHLVQLLERSRGPDLRLFDDYLEAVAFILFIGLLKEMDITDAGVDVTSTHEPLPG
jgi:hypothetical protein